MKLLDVNVVLAAALRVIVDDHASLRSSARLLLESEGFEVLGEAEDDHTDVDHPRGRRRHEALHWGVNDRAGR